jgi:glycosyltransferase involved in cell wall biosynthesis
VLVDSASTDRTVDLANQFPIRILRLRDSQPLSPSAGRYIGYNHTSGDLILFLDGDMELFSGWVQRACQVLEQRPEAAGITGHVIDLPKAASPEDRQVPEGQQYTGVAAEVPKSRGAAMYRRSVLESVGTFNPYLHSDEEPELCVRIRHAGYKILHLDYPIAFHYSDPAEEISTLVGRWRRRLYLGHGQCLRYHLRDGLLWAYVKERGHGLIPILGLGVGFACLVISLLTSQWIWFVAWLALLVMTVLGDAIRKRSAYRAVRSLVHRAFIVDGTVRGFVKKPLVPSSYPAEFDTVR